MGSQAANYLRLFVIEGSDHAELLGKGWPCLAGARFEEAPVAELFRHAHSIKGMAAAMGFEEIVALARATEQLLSELQARRVCLPEDPVKDLLPVSDLLSELIRRRGAGEDQPEDSELSPALARLRALKASVCP
jgi:two-component system, chemotaxis family, sensor kinase CheA